MAPAVKTSKSPDSKAAETKKALKANAKAAVEGKPKKDMKVDVKEEDEKKKKNMAGDVKEAAENALSRPKRKAVDSVSSYKEKTVRLSDKDSKIQVKAEQDEATEESALVTTMGTLPTKGDELPRRRMVDLIVYDGEGKAQPIELLDTGYEDGLWARGYMLPVNGPTDKKSGVLCEIGPIEDWLIDDYDSPEPDGVKVILVTPMAEYSVVGVNRAYKKLMDPVLDGAAAFRHCYRALAKHLGGNPAMSLDDLLVRLARGPPAPSGGKFTREAVLRSGRFVLKQMRQVDATAAATDGDDDDGDGDRQNMSSLPALVALSAEVEAFEAAAVAFERVPGALTIRDGANSNRGGASAANGGPGGSSSGAGGSSKGKGTDDGLDEDARLALKLQKEEDALAGITARGRGGRGGNGAGGRGARGGASGGATASPGSLRGGPYIKIAEAEIADDYPEPAFYSKTEEEADEYLFYADDAEAIPVEDLPRRRLTNFAFYNSEGRLVPLELLPMWGGVDPDVDMFGSGDMVEEDPESEWTGGEDAALPSSDTSGALDGSNAAGAGSSGGSGSEVASGSGAGASGSGSASGLGASGSGGSGSGGAGSGSNAGASGSGGSGSGSSAGASGSGGSSSASGMDASGGGAAPTGIRIFLSEIKEWVVEYGAGMLFVSVRTDGAWYRLGQPAPQYGPWYTPVIRAARLAVAAITMLASEPRAARLSFNDIARRMADKGLFGSAAGSATATLPAPGPTSEDATAGDGDGGDDSEPAGAPMDTDASATGADVSGKDGADVIMADAAADGKGSGGAKGGAVKGAKKGAAVASASARLARQVAEAERFLVVHGQIVSNLFRDYPNTTIQRCGFLSQLAERMAARRHTRLDLKKADARGLLARRTRGRNLNPTAGARPDVTKRKAMRATMTKLVYRVFKGAFVGDAEEGEEGQARDKPGVPVPLVADAGNEGEELKEEENEDEDEEGGRGKGASGRKNKSGKDTVAAKEGGKKGGKKAKPVAAGEKAGWVGDSVGAMRGGQVRLYATARASDGVEFGVGDVVAVRALPGGSLAGADASMSNSEDDENNAAARPQLVLVRYLSEQTGVADGSHNKGDDGEARRLVHGMVLEHGCDTFLGDVATEGELFLTPVWVEAELEEVVGSWAISRQGGGQGGDKAGEGEVKGSEKRAANGNASNGEVKSTGDKAADAGGNEEVAGGGGLTVVAVGGTAVTSVELRTRPWGHEHRKVNAAADAAARRDAAQRAAKSQPPLPYVRSMFCADKGGFWAIPEDVAACWGVASASIKAGNGANKASVAGLTAKCVAAYERRQEEAEKEPGAPGWGWDGKGVVVVTSAADASNSSSGSGAGAGDATSFRFEGKEYHTDQYVYVWPEFVPPEVNPGGGKKSETATPAAAPDASFKAGKNIGSRPFVVGQIVSFESSKVRGGKGGSGGASAGAGARVLATVEQVTLRRFYRNEDIGGSERAYKGDIQELYYSDQTVTVPLDALAPGSPIVCCHRELFDIAAFRAQPHAFVCNLAFDPATKAIKKLHLDKLNTAKSAAGAATAGAGKGKGKAPAVDVAGAGKGKGKMVAEPAELDGSYGGAGSDHDAGKLRTMDIFAGCGGLSEGFHQSGVTVTRWAIEYDQPASEAFSLNNPRAAVFCENCNVVLRGVMEKSGQLDECVSTPEADEGAAKLTAETLARLPRPGEVDFITGGPPCQGFSGMNRFNKGQWSRIQCEMILAFLSFADVYRPRFFLLENVRNFVTFNKGLTFRLALASLLEIGYQLRVGVLQAGYYGVAQSRKRAFIIAAAPGETLPDWPEPMHVFHSPQMGVPLPGGDSYRAVPESKDGAPLRTTTVRDVIGDLPPVGNGAAEPVLKYAVPPVSWFQKMIRGHRDEGADGGAKGVDGGIAPSEELRDHISKEMNELNVLRCKHIPKRAGADWRDLPDIKVKLSNGKEEALIPWCLPNTAARHNQWKGLFGRLAWEGNFPTAITDPQPMGKVGMCFHPEQDRIVTVRECARAQGFPDVYRFAGNIQAMHRQIGNAVPPPLALALGRKLKEALSGGSGDSSK